jgi:2-oxoisovalerate dehydrogenase E1 component
MGVYWATKAAEKLNGSIEVLDLRTLNPIDNEAIYGQAKKHGKVLVLTEETLRNSLAEALAGRISKNCFEYLDAPVETLGSANLPAVSLNMGLEKEMLPNADKVYDVLASLLAY